MNSSINRRPVSFKNADGITLTGVLEMPHSASSDVAVVMLSPGVKMRVAPHRLYNKLSKWFVDQGFTVLRFDFYGLGDSEGSLPERLMADFYRQVQLGRYCSDVVSAVDWIRENLGIDRFLLAGLCGGAITGLLASQKIEGVLGLVGIGIPVILDGSDLDQFSTITEGQRNQLKRTYLRKVFDAKSWIRLLTMKTDIRLLVRSLFGKRVAHTPSRNTAGMGADNSNPLFAPAFFKFTDMDRRLLLIFSGGDRLAWEFEEKFSARFPQELSEVGDLCQIRTIPNANHIVSDLAGQKALFDILGTWIQSHRKILDPSR
ncbi:MAG: alpha/beta fold hydrolase [Pseudomonadales bacterium]